MAGDADEALAEQIAYYRRRAAEYDETSVGDVEIATRCFGRIVHQLAPSGTVLEVACGTRLWTPAPRPGRGQRDALDSSPKMIHLARSRINDRPPEFINADVFRVAAGAPLRLHLLRFLALACPAGPLPGLLAASAGLARSRPARPIRR